MGWNTIRQVFGRTATRRAAVRRLIPLLAAALALLGWTAWQHGRAALIGTAFGVALILPLVVYGVAHSIERPPTQQEAFRRLTIIWSILIATWCILYLARR